MINNKLLDSSFANAMVAICAVEIAQHSADEELKTDSETPRLEDGKSIRGFTVPFAVPAIFHGERKRFKPRGFVIHYPLRSESAGEEYLASETACIYLNCVASRLRQRRIRS